MVKRFKAKLGSTAPGSLFIEVPFDVKGPKKPETRAARIQKTVKMLGELV